MRQCRLGLFAAAGLALAALVLAPPARAAVQISIDKQAQSMTVTVDGDPRYVWPVSTGLNRWDTPNGVYQPSSMKRHHYSREWDDAPMPHSIFFTNRGHAIHGSGHVRRLGMPASHGCVRLSPENAATLFALVREHGMDRTRIALAGSLPTRQELMARLKDAREEEKRAERDREGDGQRDDGDPVTAALEDERREDGERPRDLASHPEFRAYRENGRDYYIRIQPREVRRVYRHIRRFFDYW